VSYQPSITWLLPNRAWKGSEDKPPQSDTAVGTKGNSHSMVSGTIVQLVQLLSVWNDILWSKTLRVEGPPMLGWQMIQFTRMHSSLCSDHSTVWSLRQSSDKFSESRIFEAISRKLLGLWEWGKLRIKGHGWSCLHIMLVHLAEVRNIASKINCLKINGLFYMCNNGNSSTLTRTSPEWR